MSLDFSPSFTALDRYQSRDRSLPSKGTVGNRMASTLFRFEAYMVQRATTKQELAQAAFRGDIPSEVTHVLEQNGVLADNWRAR